MKRNEPAYAALSGVYDALMTDGQYRQRTEFLVKVLRKSGVPVKKVLDLACGTGTVSWGLARRGYQVIGVDASEEMLAEAAAKTGGLFRGETPRFLCQSMTRLDLGETVDAAVSTLDAVNYLTTTRELREAFRRVAKHLEPGGLFVFDVNTPERLRSMDGQVNLSESRGNYSVWRTFFSERRKVCTWQVDLFREKEDGSWERRSEEHRERAWRSDELIAALEAAGFDRVRIAGDLSLHAPAEDEARWTVLAEKARPAEKPEKREKPEKPEKPEKAEKAEKPEKKSRKEKKAETPESE